MGINFLDLLLPRETKFFDYLNQFSELVFNSCNTLRDLVLQIESLSDEEVRKRLYIIKDYELKGDQVEMTIIKELSRCFITPLDREDIHTLAIHLDRPLNILKDLACKIETYKIRRMPLQICQFSEIILNVAKLQQDIIRDLSGKQNVRKKVEQMHKLENQADELFHSSVAELLEKDDVTLTVHMIKFKEIYELLDAVVDSLDEVGQLVRGIKIKHG